MQIGVMPRVARGNEVRKVHLYCAEVGGSPNPSRYSIRLPSSPFASIVHLPIDDSNDLSPHISSTTASPKF